MSLLYHHCYTHYRALGFARQRAALLAWRSAQQAPPMDVHGLWPMITIVALSYAAGAGSMLLLIGLMKAAGRYE